MCLLHSWNIGFLAKARAGHGHNLLLDRLPANEALAEEEEDPARALASVDVVGVVAVPDKMCLPRTPRV